MKFHVKTDHEKKYNHKCVMCQKAFTELHLFEQHKYKQHGLGNPVACEKCGKELAGKASLGKHLLGCGVPKIICCQEEQC